MTMSTQARRGDSPRYDRKTVLFISALDLWSMGAGKGGPALSQIVQGYVDRGWQVVLVTANKDDGTQAVPAPDIRVIRFGIPWFGRFLGYRRVGFFARAAWWLWFQVMALVKAWRVRSRYQPAIVYGYEIHGVPAAKLLSKLWGIPLVSRFQGILAISARFDRKLWRLLYWNYILAYSLPADLVIMTNDGTQGDRVLERLGVDFNRFRFWMNGIDHQRFGELPPKEQARRNLDVTAQYVMLTVSRLVPFKRVERTINALPEIVHNLPDTLLIVVGDGPERKRLEELASTLGVSQYVRFEGAVSHEDVPKYLAAADVFISLYDWSNVGNPLIEAMMAGKCIVTLDVGDTGRFIQNGDNGVLLSYDQLPALPSIIEGLLTDEGHQKRLGEKAKRFAEEQFWTWEERIEAEISAVSSLIRQRRDSKAKARLEDADE